MPVLLSSDLIIATKRIQRTLLSFLPHLFLFLACPVVAQEADIRHYRGRLPENTVLYLSWDRLENFGHLRPTNPLLRFLDSPEMKANWEALKEFSQRQQETQTDETKPNDDEELPGESLALGELVPLLTNPGLFAVLIPPPSKELSPPGRELVSLYLYDSSGKEEFLARLQARQAQAGDVIREYDFDGIVVVESLDAKGKPKDYKARIGRWLVGGDNKEAVEAWIRAIQQTPERSLKDTLAYHHALNNRDPGAQVELFFNVAAVLQLAERTAAVPSDKARISPKQALDSLGVDDWELVLLTLAIDPERVRYRLAALHRENAAGPLDFLAHSVPDFPSLDFAPEDALSYTVIAIDVSAIWAYVQRVLTDLLPPQQARLVTGFQGMMEGILGITLEELAAAWGNEYAQFSYPSADAGEVHSLRVLSVGDRERVLTALRNIVTALGPQLSLEELAPEPADGAVTYFQLALFQKQEESHSEPFYVAVSGHWLLLGRSKAEIRAALARFSQGPSLRQNPSFQQLRARFPAALATFSFVDADRWLASGAASELLAQITGAMVEAARNRKKDEDEQKSSRDPSEPPTPDVKKPAPELARRQAEEPSPEPPQMEIPRGYLKWLFSATTRDARGFYHTGYIE